MSDVCLHGFGPSVYTWAARLALQVKGVAFRHDEITPFDPVDADRLARLHPFGRVPVLAHQGRLIYETAAEAEIAYACMAHITDYDVWHETEEPVTVEAVMKIAQSNVANAKKAIAAFVQRIDTNKTRPAHDNLKFALTTQPNAVPDDVRQRLNASVGK